jgi:hypothetical protein
MRDPQLTRTTSAGYERKWSRGPFTCGGDVIVT